MDQTSKRARPPVNIQAKHDRPLRVEQQTNGRSRLALADQSRRQIVSPRRLLERRRRLRHSLRPYKTPITSPLGGRPIRIA